MSTIRLVDHVDDAKRWSVEDMLHDSIQEVGSGERECSKALVVFLDDTEGRYNMGFSNAGLSASESVALLEAAKKQFLKYLVPDYD